MNSKPTADHASCLFLLDEGCAPVPLPHDEYVAIARRERGTPDLAGRRLRLADWYVRLKDGRPEQLVSEWYGWVEFDRAGCFDPPPADAPHAERGNVDESALPTQQERQALHQLLWPERPTNATAAASTHWTSGRKR